MYIEGMDMTVKVFMRGHVLHCVCTYVSMCMCVQWFVSDNGLSVVSDVNGSGQIFLTWVVRGNV